LLLVGLVLLYVFFFDLSHYAFKMSVSRAGVKNLLYYQFVGNFAGFLAVICYTIMLKFLPLYLAFAIATGLGQLFLYTLVSRVVLKEVFGIYQVIGIVLILAGILLVSRSSLR